MSKFKSYAEQGAFSKNLLNLPDASKKIQEEGARRIRGMNVAQAALEKNQQLFLAAQQQAQNVEMKTREMNEKFERENRQQYIDALKRDNQIENANRAAEQQRQQKILGDLAKFSVSAVKQLVDTGAKNEKRRVDQINARIEATGMGHQDLMSYINIDKTFTDQQALQSDIGIKLLEKYGDTPEIRSLLTNARNDASYRYTQSTAAVINDINSKLPGHIDATLANMAPDASYEEQMAAINTSITDFRSEQGIDPRFLEGIAGDRIRSIKNTYTAALHTQTQKQAALDRKQDQFTVFTTKFGAQRDNVEAVVAYVNENPSRTKRLNFFEWAENGLKSGMISNDAYRQMIFEKKYEFNGKQVTLAEQFADSVTGEIAKAKAALTSKIQQDNQAYRQEQATAKLQIDSELTEYYNTNVIADGRFQKAELERMEQLAEDRGYRLEELPIFDRLKGLTDDERAQESALEMLANDFANLNMSREKILSMQLPYQAQVQAFNMLNQQDKITESPTYDMNLDRVRQFPMTLGDNAAAVKLAYRDGRNKDNIDQYTNQLELEFKRLVGQGASPEEAAAAVAQRHVSTNGGLDKINEIGQYNSVIEDNKKFLKGHSLVYDQYRTFRDGMSNFYATKDPKIITNSLSPKMLADFNQAYDQPGTSIPSFVRAYANERNKDPLQVMNDMGIALGKDEYDVVDPTYLNIKRNLPPQKVRLMNTYRDVQQRTGRALNTTFPVRSTFAQLDRSKGATYSQGQLMGIAIEAGFTTEQAHIMSAIAMAESGGRIAIDTVQSGLDPNKEREFSIGAFMINVQAHQDKLDRNGFTEDDLRDPRKAIIIAKEVYDEAVTAGRDGFAPWSVYTNGRYNEFMNSIQY